MKKVMTLMSLALVAGALSMGCAGKTDEKPTTAAAPTPETTPAPEKESYVVKKGDSLWKISSQSSVLGDPFRWPLLFRANRDQIEDPDLIQVSQDLNYEKDYSADEVASAVEKAKETPPFTPHATPRKSLPVSY